MKRWHRQVLRGVGVIALLSCAHVSALQAQVIPFEKRVFNEEVLRPHSQPVIPLFDGWYKNADGTFDMCFGYINLNTEEPLDIPLGERNFIEPREFDGKQPTHFDVIPGMTAVSQMTSTFRRYYCAFTVTVPADFGEQRQVVWHLQRQGGESAPVSDPGTLNPFYIMDEVHADGRGDTAPFLRLAANGTQFQGRHGYMLPTKMTTRVGRPLQLSVSLEHPFEKQVWVAWMQFSGPGKVTFSPAEQRAPISDGKGVAATTATFSEPGEYELWVQSTNSTASLEFHCCSTNGYVKVTVTP
jgi:hypothetical protein